MPYSITITADTLDEFKELSSFTISITKRIFTASPNCTVSIVRDEKKKDPSSSYPTPAPHSDQYPPFRTWGPTATDPNTYVGTETPHLVNAGDAIAKAVDLSRLDAKVPAFAKSMEDLINEF